MAVDGNCRRFETLFWFLLQGGVGGVEIQYIYNFKLLRLTPPIYYSLKHASCPWHLKSFCLSNSSPRPPLPSLQVGWCSRTYTTGVDLSRRGMSTLDRMVAWRRRFLVMKLIFIFRDVLLSKTYVTGAVPNQGRPVRGPFLLLGLQCGAQYR